MMVRKKLMMVLAGAAVMLAACEGLTVVQRGNTLHISANAMLPATEVQDSLGRVVLPYTVAEGDSVRYAGHFKGVGRDVRDVADQIRSGTAQVRLQFSNPGAAGVAHVTWTAPQLGRSCTLLRAQMRGGELRQQVQLSPQCIDALVDPDIQVEVWITAGSGFTIQEGDDLLARLDGTVVLR